MKRRNQEERQAMANITINIPHAYDNALQSLIKFHDPNGKNNISRSSLIRQAIKNRLDQEEKALFDLFNKIADLEGA